MGIDLVEEVLDHAPDGLTSGQRLLLFALAKDANDTTRRCWPGDEKLRRWTRLKGRAIREATEALVKAGLVIRIPYGIDCHGQPIYARRGRNATFELARLIHRPQKGGATPPPRTPKLGGGTEQLGGGTEQLGGATPPPSPQFSSSLVNQTRASRDLALVVEAVENRTGKIIDHDWAQRIVTMLVAGRPEVRNPARYAATAIDRDANPHRFLPTAIPPPFRPRPPITEPFRAVPPDPPTNGHHP